MYQEWIHPEKRRYYRVSTCIDLLGDRVMVQDFGSLDTHRGRRITRPIPGGDTDKAIRAIGKIRIAHGYRLKWPASFHG